MTNSQIVGVCIMTLLALLFVVGLIKAFGWKVTLSILIPSLTLSVLMILSVKLMIGEIVF